MQSTDKTKKKKKWTKKEEARNIKRAGVYKIPCLIGDVELTSRRP